MRIADLLTAVILALGGGLVVYDSVRLGIGWGSDGPRSGFFPFWLAVIMIVACVAIMLQALRRTPTEPFLTRERLGPVLKVLWPATAAVVLMQFVEIGRASCRERAMSAGGAVWSTTWLSRDRPLCGRHCY